MLSLYRRPSKVKGGPRAVRAHGCYTLHAYIRMPGSKWRFSEILQLESTPEALLAVAQGRLQGMGQGRQPGFSLEKRYALLREIVRNCAGQHPLE